MGGARWRLPLLVLALLVVTVIASTPTERAEAQSVPNVWWNALNALGPEPSDLSQQLQLQVNQNLTAALTVSYTLGGTATPGVDYTIDAGSPDYAARTGTFTIPAGTARFTSVFFPVTILEDAVSDSGETIILAITDGADYNLGTGSTVTATIVENSGKAAFRIGGQPQVNGTLTGHRVCDDADGNGNGTLSYQWQRKDRPGRATFVPIGGATSQSYTLQQADAGYYLRLRVEYTDGNSVTTRVYTPIIGPIGPVVAKNTVGFSRDSYNVREGDPLRPTLTFSSPTAQEQTFEITFQTCDADLRKDISVDYAEHSTFVRATDVSAAHSVTVPAGVTSHTFSLPVPLDGEIEGYETFVMGFGGMPREITIGDQSDATNQGQYAVVQIADVNFVPENWSLKPSGVSAGDQFRLLFRTDNERNGSSGDIGVYDTFVRNRIGGASTGHADIRQYRDTFRVVGSTGTVDAAWHTATGIMVSGEPSHTPFSHPIHWLNGPKVADDYNDFWDGTWDNNSHTAARNANGVAPSTQRGPNTGTQTGTTHATAGVKHNHHLGHGSMVRWGRGSGNNPISQGGHGVSNNNVYLGLSGIFLPLDVSAANPLVTIETRQTRVEEGTDITYTLRAIPAPSSPVIVNVKVTETTDGGLNFVQPGSHGAKTPTISTSGVLEFTVGTVNDEDGEPDGGVTVSIGSGTGYRTLAASDTAMTVITSSDVARDISVSAALGDGSNGPAQTGANVDFTFSLPKPWRGSDLSGIRTQLAWGGDVLSPRSDNRPTTWDRYAVNPNWKSDGSAKVSRLGYYVRPWLESSISPGDRSFSRRVHVKNRAEAGGDVGNGWIAMRVAPDPNPDDESNHYVLNSQAEWACMPVGGGTCPSAWPGVPTASIVPLDNGTVVSGNDARYRITVNPAPAAGQTRQVYLKTWEVFVKPTDPKVLIVGGVRIKADGSPFNAVEEAKLTGLVEIDAKGNPMDEDVVVEIQTQRGIQYKYYYNQPRRGGTQVQFTAYSHVDVGSGGSAEFTLPTKIYRSTENMAGRNYWAEVQEDIAYSVGDGSSAEVATTVFDTAQAACWYGHSHHAARLITVDGAQVYSPAGMGITECLTSDEIDNWVYGNGSTSNRPTVWTSCKPDYGHREHPYTDGNGNIHHHHNHDPYIKLGDGSCPGGQPQTDGGDSQDGEQDQQDDPFPEPGAMGFSDVTDSSMTLSWSQREVDHYLVYWAEAVENADVQFVQVDAGTLTHTLTGLKADTEYAVIVYSQDYDEVTPTAYQRTAAATCDTADAEQKARAAYDWHVNNNGPDEGLFWRILNTLGAGNMPAKPADVTVETVTAQYVEDYSDGKSWGGWTPIVTALECVEGDGSAQQDATPATPEISIVSNGDITEGGNASFTLTANPAPAANLDVTVAVAQSGDYGVTPGSQTVSIPTTGSYTLTIPTVNDGLDEADGSVTATVSTGAGYTVSATAGSATVAVADDDAAPPATPEISITAGSGITEGGNATFTVTANPAPASALSVSVSVTQSGDYGVNTGSRTVTIPTTGSYTLTVATVNDNVDEADGSVTATVSTGAGYTVSTTAGSVTVAVADDDVPEISITGGTGITEGGNASFTLTANPAPTTALSVSVSVAQTGDYGVSTGSQTVSIPTTGSYTLTVATVNDALDEADGSVTVTVDTGQDYTVSAIAGTATVAVADDDDPPPPDATPSLSVSDGSAREDAGVMEFTVSLSAASDKKVQVMAATTSFRYKTATIGDDFERTWVMLTFAPGETSKTVQVVILDDDLSEGDESFGMFLAYSHTNTPVTREHGEGVIIDDD